MRVEPHDTAEELIKASKSKENARISERLKIIALAMKGETANFLAEMFTRSPRWIRGWVMRYNEKGIEGLKDLPRTGQPKRLSTDQEDVFKKRVLDGPLEKDKMIVFRGEDLQKILKAEFNADYTTVEGVYALLKRLGISHIKPRPRHPLNDEKAMEKWKEENSFFLNKSKKTTQKKK